MLMLDCLRIILKAEHVQYSGASSRAVFLFGFAMNEISSNSNRELYCNVSDKLCCCIWDVII